MLAAVIFAATQLRDAPPDTPAAEEEDYSIAVLPLSNLSSDPADAVLADGLTEELIAMLAKTGELRVIASTSAFAFRNRMADVRGIADSLGVSNILEGGVQKIGSRLRVQVRLVDADDGSTRWSETYDREIEDMFAVQEEIARAVARELGARLAGGNTTQLSRNRARNVAAYELYLRGSNTALLRSDSAVREGLEYFRQAVAIDSTYAAAYAGMSRMYNRLVGTGYGGMPDRDLKARAEEAALTAVALDDSLAEAHAVLGIVRMNALDFASAESEFKRAIELDPNHARIREWMVHLYLWTERPTEALAEARRALEIDPLSATAHAEVARTLVANHRYDEALAHLEQIADVQPPLLRTPWIAAQAYAGKEMWPEAIAALGCLPEEVNAVCAYMLARGEQRAEALRIQAKLIEHWGNGEVPASHVAIGYAGLGDFDQAFTWLEKSMGDNSLKGVNPSIMDPIFEDLREDPRFDLVREQLGIQKR
ncbi:MAG TPA: tetratricopeptide repeat protein [Gemmatimonadota bacterium]|nr:tetratricopeptide repeat protein [Gemmatimonadota bacterium]